MVLQLGCERRWRKAIDNDQVIMVENLHPLHCTLRRLGEHYEKWGLTINIKKTVLGYIIIIT